MTGKEKIDIIIFGGQSNMQGSTGSFPTEPPAENCIEYKFLTDSFEQLKHPVGETIGDLILSQAAEGNGSLVPSFCREYSKTKGKVLAIHVARGATTIEQWLKGTEIVDGVTKKVVSGDLRYGTLRDKCLAGIKKAKENFKVNKIYFVWLQGESNAVSFTTSKDYTDMLLTLKNQLKQDLGIDKFAIIQVGYFCAYAPWLEGKKPFEIKKQADEEIMSAQRNICKVDSDFVFLTDITAKLSVDGKYLNEKECGPHYNNEAMIIIGTEAGKALAKLDI